MSASDMPDLNLQQPSQAQRVRTHNFNSQSISTVDRRDPFVNDGNDSDHERSFFMTDAFASHNTASTRMTRRQKLTQDRTRRKRLNRHPIHPEPAVATDENDAGSAAINPGWRPVGTNGSVSAAPAATRQEHLRKGTSPALKENHSHQQPSKAVFRNPSPVTYGITRLTPSTSSSSDTEVNKEGSYEDPQMLLLRNPTRSELSASAITPDVAAFFHQQQSSSRSARSETYDEEDVDDSNSQESLSYHKRLAREEMEMKARKEAVDAAKAEMRSTKFMQKEDVESYRKTLETPIAKTVGIVSAAAIVGCVVLGPVGLLVGAAAVGIGAGAMQIPEEHRNNMMKSAQESVMSAGDAISQSCMNTYKDSGIAEHVPADIQSCCATMDVETKELLPTSESEIVMSENDESIVASRSKTTDQTSPVAPAARVSKNKNGRVACLREGRIMTASQIHALNPVLQPRAWLDVLASAEAVHDDRVEAMEEVMILAKDKQRARVLVDEGILDSLMWSIGRYTEKVKYDPASHELPWAHPEISLQEKSFARLAATCCINLGKSYCAAMHTEGDLLLMSQYERGTVPEERQLAQLLYEVPHHVRITRTDDPTIVDPSKEVFALRQMTLPQAEELAASIKALMASTD
ncbi:hypothetical protein FisN_13Hh080 [Fistulifera solaris]|uniref:Uncharacterized protein n=1 Tax=Fistulifera solaris TaxID=1519565 RepID=A0A1Z5KNA4_FISSO|nr:hypothetical protein FisN_13Hh080 [Fistulifera solaris]|eukprot:GAX27813.1 hypothetical protein FisN_13Hh080 [Fistulifera solaris]